MGEGRELPMLKMGHPGKKINKKPTKLGAPGAGLGGGGCKGDRPGAAGDTGQLVWERRYQDSGEKPELVLQGGNDAQCKRKVALQQWTKLCPGVPGKAGGRGRARGAAPRQQNILIACWRGPEGLNS